MSRPRAARLAALLYGVAAAAYLIDRVTKVLAERTLEGRPPVDLIPGVLRLRFTENPGGAFSLFVGAPSLFLVATLAATAAIVWASRSLSSAGVAAGLGLILGGALGNLTDRILRGPGISGKVVDFVDLRIWPVFNVADSAIVLGAITLIVLSFRHRSEPAGR